MDESKWSHELTGMYFTQHDPESDLQKFRNFIPSFVLRRFCSGPHDPSLHMYGQNMITYDPESLTIYDAERGSIERKPWSEVFGKEDVYSAYFDNLKKDTWLRDGFRKFDTLKRVDGDIMNGLTDPVWQIMQYQHKGRIPLRRDDVNTLRKYLYLMTTWAARDRTSHLFAHNPYLDTARQRRRRFVENHGLDHVRDVWLHNAEQIICTPHTAVADTTTIFDLDAEDYWYNARERYIVFWEAPPGHEFVLTESAFGGYEGGEIGAKKNSSIDVSPREMETHVYTRDFMWHQLYVLSPNLVMALCHPSLMHPDLAQKQKERWGMRRSLLDDLPHDLPAKYYKDISLDEMSIGNLNWNLPPGVQACFGTPNRLDRHMNDEIVFPIHKLAPGQVAQVNAVLLHNQENGPKIKNVCIPPSQSPGYLQFSLDAFLRNPWPKYSNVEQNNYAPLMNRLQHIMTPPMMSPVLSPTFSQFPMLPVQNGQMFNQQLPNFPALDYPVGNGAYEGSQFLAAPQHHTHANSTHSSLNSLTPSSQSSYSYSSASSQASTSTKSTSIDTPRLDRIDRHRSPTEKEQRKAKREQLPLLDRPRSDSSGKTVRSKQSDRVHREVPQGMNIFIEQAPTANSSASGGVPVHRGRNPEPRYDPPSKPPSKRASPTNTPAEFAYNYRYTDQPMQTQMASPTSRQGALPERPNYVTDNPRPTLAGRSRTEPQVHPVLQIPESRPSHYHLSGGIDQYLETQPSQRRRSPERQHAMDQIPRRMNRSPERIFQQQRPVAQRLATAPQGLRYEQPHPGNASRSPERLAFLDARSGQYETTSQPISRQSSQSSNVSRVSRMSSADLHNPNAESVVESQINQIMSATRPQIQPLALQPRRSEMSPDRKPEPQRVPSSTWEKPRSAETTNGYYYELVSGQDASQPIEPSYSSLQLPPQRSHSKRGSANSSRNTSATSEYPMRLTQQPEPTNEEPPPAKLTPPPVTIERLPTSREEDETPQVTEAPAIAPPVNPVVKQLRFETPPRKQLTHKLSDMSLAGSTVAHFGDSPYQLALVRTPGSDYGSDSETESGTESGDDASWEDEGHADPASPAEEQPKRAVRFAEKLVSMSPARTSTSSIARRGHEIERPNSRLGKSVPRPLSKAGHSRFERFESRKAKGTHPVFPTRARA